MKFEFKYRSLLKIRRHEQKREQQKLAAMINRKTDMQRSLTRLLETPEHPALRERGRHSVQGMRRGYEHHMGHLKRIWNLQEKLENLGLDIKEQRRCLMEANRKTRMLEKLKAKERMRFIEELQHREQLLQNEVATQMYNRAS